MQICKKKFDMCGEGESKSDYGHKLITHAMY